MATAYTDLACQSSDTELCNEWKQVSFYLQIGLLSLNAVDGINGLETLIRKTDEVVVEGGKFANLENVSKLPDGVLVKLIGSDWTDDILTKLDADLADETLLIKVGEDASLTESWKALSEFSILRKNTTNLEVLNKVRGKFIYNGKTEQEALEEIFSGHKSAQKLIDNLSKAEELFKGIGIKQWSGIKSSGEVRLIGFKDGKEVVLGRIDNGKFAVTAPKGTRPDPDSYLTQKYIDDHLAKFTSEGGAFIVVKSWTEGGNPKYASLPPRKFVGLRSEMDEVIDSYKSSQDWTILRDKLNLGESTNLANDEIYYIKLDPKDPRFSYDIPHGNEGGAIPDEWVPGGETGNRTTEAALVGSENIVHNKDIDELLMHFNSDSWEKVK